MTTASESLSASTEPERLSWARWGRRAAFLGMASWVVGVALIPLEAKLENGAEALTLTLSGNSARLYLASLLAILGGVLLVAFFATLTRLIPEGAAGWGLIRVSLAGCVVTQTMVAIGGAFALIAIHSAVAGASPELVALCWRGLWLTFLASAVPTILFTCTGVMAMGRAGLASSTAAVLGWISAAAHVLVLFTLAQSGPMAPDGLVSALVPITTVIWIVVVAAGLARRVR